MLLLHACSVFAWIMIQMQWLSHFKWKYIYFIDLGFVLKFELFLFYFTYFNFNKKHAAFCLRTNKRTPFNVKFVLNLILLQKNNCEKIR